MPKEKASLDSCLSRLTDPISAGIGGFKDDSAAAIVFRENKESGWDLPGRHMICVWKRCKVRLPKKYKISS